MSVRVGLDHEFGHTRARRELVQSLGFIPVLFVGQARRLFYGWRRLDALTVRSSEPDPLRLWPGGRVLDYPRWLCRL